MATFNTGPTPPLNPGEPEEPVFPIPPNNLPHVAGLPPPVHIYNIPIHLRRLVTMDLAVIHHRATTASDLRELIKCFYSTIPRVRMATKAELVNSFIYYIVPILHRPHIFDREGGHLYSFDVPYQIELQDEPEDTAAGSNDNQDGEAAQGAANDA